MIVSFDKKKPAQKIVTALCCISSRFSLNESDESAKDKWSIMRTRREQRADHVGDWKVVDGERKTEVITATGSGRNPRRRDERRETAKLNGCDSSHVWARLFRTRAST